MATLGSQSRESYKASEPGWLHLKLDHRVKLEATDRKDVEWSTAGIELIEPTCRRQAIERRTVAHQVDIQTPT